MQVAKSALPLLLQRAERMLSNHMASSSVVGSNEEESSLEDFQCLLEVLQVLTVTPSITDAVLTPGSPLKVCCPSQTLPYIQSPCLQNPQCLLGRRRKLNKPTADLNGTAKDVSAAQLLYHECSYRPFAARLYMYWL